MLSLEARSSWRYMRSMADGLTPTAPDQRPHADLTRSRAPTGVHCCQWFQESLRTEREVYAGALCASSGVLLCTGAALARIRPSAEYMCADVVSHMRINTTRARTLQPEARHRKPHWSVADAPGALAARELRRGTGPRLIARYAGV